MVYINVKQISRTFRIPSSWFWEKTPFIEIFAIFLKIAKLVEFTLYKFLKSQFLYQKMENFRQENKIHWR
jgi:hypothetical protein